MKTQLSQRKQNELELAKTNAIEAGVQYNVHYESFTNYSSIIDTDEKRSALLFLLDEMLDFVELDVRMAPVVENLGDPATKTELNYREFKLLQEMMKGIKIKGRANIIRLSQALKAFNSDGVALNELETLSQQFANHYQSTSNKYAKMCNDFKVEIEDIDSIIDSQVEEYFANKSEENK